MKRHIPANRPKRLGGNGIIIADIASLLGAVLIYALPFYFILVNSFKDRKNAGLMNLLWPETLHIVENYSEVLAANNNAFFRGFVNSAIITAGSILLLALVCSMAGYVIHRRSKGKLMVLVSFIILAGLMVPPSIMPTISVLKWIGVYKTLFGMILVEVALNIPFATILYRGYMVSIPKEMEEAALVDGCGKIRLFFQVVLPLLLPVTSTIAVLTGIQVFNDFTNPLYFLPGANNVTVQLTLYGFLGKYGSYWNMLFADVVLITIPPLILFIVLNKKIVSGLTAGAIKG